MSKNLPNYFGLLKTASHSLYWALEEIRHTPGANQEVFDKLVKIYVELEDFSDEIEVAASET